MDAQLLQSRPTLCYPVDYSLPGSSVHGILQARILEWVAFTPPGDLPDSGIEPMSPETPALQADSLLRSHWGNPQNIYTRTVLRKWIGKPLTTKN